MDRMTGERPVQGLTPDSLMALHDAGYREVSDRLGPGMILDAGCGLGFESARFIAPGRDVYGFDYDAATAASARTRFSAQGLRTSCTDAAQMGFRDRSFDYVCSSHLIEHFWHPEQHAAEMARILRDTGTAMILTPNRPADFENPFHLVLFVKSELEELLGHYFEDVWVGGLEGSPAVKADFAARRIKAERVLRFDVLRLRHRIPRSWYIAAYTRLLPVAYRLMARGDAGGDTGITQDDFQVTDTVEDDTAVLFAVCRNPRS